MGHFVYIIYAESHDLYYKGQSEYPGRRLVKHNAGHSIYTKGRGPWRLVYLEGFGTKREAMNRERMLKRQNRKYIEWLLLQGANLLNKG